MTWETTLSDGTRVELVPGGLSLPVTLSNAPQYVHAVTRVRLREAERALAALRDGVCSVLPAAVLPLFTAEELEQRVCGVLDVDIDLLASNTEYDDDVSPSEPHIQSMWRVLREFDASNRRAFLRFVWARSRLPATSAEFRQKFKVQAPVTEGPRENPDKFLPKAHTCFFSINLPRYSSDEVGYSCCCS